MEVTCQISHCWVHPVAPLPRNDQNMALYGQYRILKVKWSSNWFLLNLNHCAQGCHVKFLIARFILLPPFLDMAKTWPFYCQNMVLTWSFKLVLPES